MSPRTDISIERKSQILDAATAVFARKGFYEASMDDIVDESGLSKGALYWYFKSKDQIISALLDRLFEPELEELRALGNAEGSARARVLEFAALTAREMKRMTRIIPLTYEFYALAFRNPAVRKKLREFLREYIRNLIPLIEQGMARGEFRQTDAAQIATALAAAGEGTLLLWVYDPKGIDLDQQLVAGMQFILDGIAANAETFK
jgi:AcrR family transcriptional regulator